MVAGTHGHAVVSRVVAAPGPEEDVIVVQVPPAAARGDCAPPPVAFEDGVAMAGLRPPLVLDVAQEALAADPVPVGANREGEDHWPEQCHDRGGRREGDRGVAKLPFGARPRWRPPDRSP